MKVRVVSEDPYERGRRATLNLGHTIGHGVESASGYRLRHGEAIAVGLVAEARLAAEVGLAEPALAEALRDVLTRSGLPVDAPGSSDAPIRGSSRTSLAPAAAGAPANRPP